jgi:hypothetical protein
MCGLCGILASADHWADTAANPEGSTPTRLRQLRARIANRVLSHYGLKLNDAAGSMALQSATGRTALVPHLGALWPAADRLTKKPCDPLDPELISALLRDIAVVRT